MRTLKNKHKTVLYTSNAKKTNTKNFSYIMLQSMPKTLVRKELVMLKYIHFTENKEQHFFWGGGYIGNALSACPFVRIYH